MTRSTNHPRYQAFIALLSTLRKSQGISQVVLAKRLGNFQTVISKIENGERRLDVVEMLEYLEAIDADIPEFIAHLMQRLRKPSMMRDRKLAVSRQRVHQKSRK